MTLFVDCAPEKVTASSGHKFGRGRAYESAELRAWTRTLTVLLKPHAPKEPLAGPLFMSVIVAWPLTQADRRTQVQREALFGSALWHAQKPDADNVVKRLIDIMQGLGFFVNDKQIVSLHIEKTRCARPGIKIVLNHCQLQPRVWHDQEDDWP